jgi:hypothetical protein
MQTPHSLTINLHLSLDREHREGATGATRAELLSQIMERAADLSPELQRVLSEFASEVAEVSVGGQSPD